MVGFKRELGGVGSHSSATGGVVDTSTAQLISDIGPMAREMAIGGVVGGLTGQAGSLEEINPEAHAGVKDIKGLDTLEKIASARQSGVISGSQAETRARAALRQSVNDSGGLFAPEIRRAYDQFFGGAGGSFFKDSLTPEQEALNEYKKEVAKLSYQMNVPLEDAADRIRRKTLRDAKAEEIKTNSELNDNNAQWLTSKMSIDIQESIQSRVLTAIGETGEKSLTPEQVRSFRLTIPQLIREKRTEFLSAYEKQGIRPSPAQTKILNDTLASTEASLNEFLDDASMQELFASKASVISNTVDIESWKSFPEAMVVKKSYGESALSNVFDALNSNQVKAFYDNNPVFKEQYDYLMGDDFKRKAGSATLKFLDPNNTSPTEFEKDSSVPLTANPEVFSQAKEKLDTLFNRAPEAVVNLTNPKWQVAIRSGKYSKEEVESYLKQALRRRKSDYMLENDTLITAISVDQGSGPVGQMGRAGRGGFVIRDQDGNKVPNKMYSTIIDVANVARKYPDMWEGNFDSPIDYAVSFIAPQVEVQEADMSDKLAPRMRQVKKTKGVEVSASAPSNLTDDSSFMDSLSKLEAGPEGYSSINAVPTGEFEGYTNAREFISNQLQKDYGSSDITERTIDELISVGERWAKAEGSGEKASSAMGFGQITAETMGMLKEKGVVKGDDLYNKGTQVKMIEWIVRNKRPAVKAYIEGKSDNLDKALKEFGLEWEAFSKPENKDTAIQILKDLRSK